MCENGIYIYVYTFTIPFCSVAFTLSTLLWYCILSILSILTYIYMAAYSTWRTAGCTHAARCWWFLFLSVDLLPFPFRAVFVQSIIFVHGDRCCCSVSTDLDSMKVHFCVVVFIWAFHSFLFITYITFYCIVLYVHGMVWYRIDFIATCQPFIFFFFFFWYIFSGTADNMSSLNGEQWRKWRTNNDLTIMAMDNERMNGEPEEERTESRKRRKLTMRKPLALSQ